MERSKNVSRMHRWVTLKEVKAVLVRVVRDYEGNLVSYRVSTHSANSAAMTYSVLAFPDYSPVPTHIA